MASGTTKRTARRGGTRASGALRFRTRTALVLAALLVQAFVLAAGWLVTFRIVQRSFARVIQDKVKHDNRDIAERVASLFPADMDGMVEFGSPEWERLQTIIEGEALADLPAGGFACLIDNGTGELLCHPDLRERPGLRDFSFERFDLLEDLDDRTPSPLLEARDDAGRPATGVVEFNAGNFHYVATKPLAGTGLRLLVHQPVGALVSVGNTSTRFIFVAAAGVLTAVLGVTGVGLTLLLRRYDSVHQRLNTQLHENLLVARRIQQAALPEHYPLTPGYAFAGSCEPADETGGDTFDVFGLAAEDACRLPDAEDAERLPVERVALLLADASGHGIGPALAVTQLHAMTRVAWRTGGRLHAVAELVNERLSDQLPSGRFVTAWFGLLDTRTHELRMLSAGQGPQLVYRAATGEVESLESDTYPLGIRPTLGVSAGRSVTLEPSDVVLIVSDGIVEAPRDDGERFGTDRLVEVFRRHAGATPPDLVEAVRRATLEFAGAGAAEDDRTVLVVRRTSA